MMQPPLAMCHLQTTAVHLPSQHTHTHTHSRAAFLAWRSCNGAASYRHAPSRHNRCIPPPPASSPFSLPRDHTARVLACGCLVASPLLAMLNFATTRVAGRSNTIGGPAGR
eukprot:356932-Chlamydomonas_euryale.AAC.2